MITEHNLSEHTACQLASVSLTGYRYQEKPATISELTVVTSRKGARYEPRKAKSFSGRDSR